MRGSISLFMLIAVLCASLTGAPALDEIKYPDWKGQRVRAHGAEAAPWDARKPGVPRPWRLGRQSALTPEYQALFESAGVKANDSTAPCVLFVMPCAMVAIHSMEIVIMRDTLRRIFTNGRAWPKERSRSMVADRGTTPFAPTGS
jgi:hypothetical protein